MLQAYHCKPYLGNLLEEQLGRGVQPLCSTLHLLKVLSQGNIR